MAPTHARLLVVLQLALQSPMMPTEQILHDRVNLARLVCRLEKTISDETWTEDPTGSSTSTPTWIRARGILQVRRAE